MHQKLLISFPNDAAINSKGYKLQSSDITFDIPTCLKNGKPSKKILYRGFSWKTEVINNFLSKNTPVFKIYSWSQQYIVMPFTCIYNRLVYERVITNGMSCSCTLLEDVGLSYRIDLLALRAVNYLITFYK